MGSLMAGWDSPVLDPKHLAYQRNRSFTQGQIEAYWRSKKERAEEELRKARSDGTREVVFEERARKCERSNSLPAELEAETTWARLFNNKGWWTRSSWAFLNEPPVFEGSASSYKPLSSTLPISTSQKLESRNEKANRGLFAQNELLCDRSL